MHRLVSALLVIVLLAPVTAAAQLLQLDRTDPGRTTLDGLLFRGAIVLPPGGGKFGGLSGLQVVDKRHLLAVSDMGRVFSLQLTWNAAGYLEKVVPDGGMSLLDENGQVPTTRTRWDSESIVKVPEGWLVGYERDHRIEQYADVDGHPGGVPVPLPPLPGIEALPRNSSLEALTRLPDGRLLALAEGSSPDGSHPGWLWQDGHWQTLSYMADEGLNPGDMTVLPDGSVLVLERGFNILYGFRVRLARINLDEIRPGARLVPVQLTRLESPVLSENFEGVAALAQPDGSVRLFIVSDNNFNAAQQTILAVFDLLAP